MASVAEAIRYELESARRVVRDNERWAAEKEEGARKNRDNIVAGRVKIAECLSLLAHLREPEIEKDEPA